MFSLGARNRSTEVAERVASGAAPYQRCRVIGCGRPPTATARSGLNQRFCRRHEDHYERHGSAYRRSYTAAQLRPHREAARVWVASNKTKPQVRFAINKVAELYYRAGRKIEAFRLAGQSPHAKAMSIWASLRDRGVDPGEVVAVWIALTHLIDADVHRVRSEEFHNVQAAKVLHRMAGGSHKKWVVQGCGGQSMITVLDKYSHSRGTVLRRFGIDLRHAMASLPQVQFEGGR